MKVGLKVRLLGISFIGMVSLLLITLLVSLKFSGDSQQAQLQASIELLDRESSTQQEVLNASLQRKAENLVSLLSMIAPDAIVSFDFDTLEQYANSAVQDDEIHWVRFLDMDQGALAESAHEEHGSHLTENRVTKELLMEGDPVGYLEIYLLQERINTAVKTMNQRASTFKQNMEMDVSKSRQETVAWSVGVGVITLLIALVLTAVLIKTGIITPIRKVNHYFEESGAGNYSNQIDLSRNDEIGKMMHDLSEMQTHLADKVEQIQQSEQRALRIQEAVNRVSTPLMVTDEGGAILFENIQLQEHLAGLEQQDGKRGNQLLEEEIQLHLKQADLSRARWSDDFAFVDRTIRARFNQVVDEQNAVVGYAIEWVDLTEQIRAQDQVASLVSSAAQGELDKRLDTTTFDGFIAKLAEEINQMLDAVANPINEVVRVVRLQAEGDLTQAMEGKYQGHFKTLQDDINTMAQRLRAVVHDIVQGAEDISQGAHQISEGSANLSQRTQQQAASVEETAASMEQMTATVSQNSDNADKADQLSKHARHIAESGSDVMHGAVDSMEKVHESSAKIVDIIATIDGLAFQTNLLALNAAVEAARAGDHGRGFAVVAGEVRNLAQRSADSASEIKALIEDSIEKIEVGSNQVNQAGENLDKIVEAVRNVSDIVEDIAAASAQQSAGIAQVDRAVNELDNTTQQNAALVEEVAASSSEMDEHAVNLRKGVGYFKTG